MNTFFEQKLIPALRRAGVRLIVGTNAPVASIPPGFAILGELQALVISGFSPYEVLVASTRNPAEFMSETKKIAIGFGIFAAVVVIALATETDGNLGGLLRSM